MALYKNQMPRWHFIQCHLFGLSHTYINIGFSEITGLFDGVFIRLLDLGGGAEDLVDLGGGAEAKIKLFQNMVMLHIKLKLTTLAATW